MSAEGRSTSIFDTWKPARSVRRQNEDLTSTNRQVTRGDDYSVLKGLKIYIITNIYFNNYDILGALIYFKPLIPT